MRHLIGVTAITLLAGCAGIESKSIPVATVGSANTDESDTGFRYYETSPFLLLYADGKGGLESRLLYLPDTTKKRSIRPYNYGAKNDTTLKFDHGRLVQAKAVVDETVIPVAVISALEKVAVAAANGNSDTLPPPVIFRILGDASGGWKLANKPTTNVTIKFVP